MIKEVIPYAKIISVDKTTEGQASTCALALPYLDQDEPMFIAACDNTFLYDKDTYTKLIADLDISSIVWTFTKDPLLTKSPNS